MQCFPSEVKKPLALAGKVVFLRVLHLFSHKSWIWTLESLASDLQMNKRKAKAEPYNDLFLKRSRKHWLNAGGKETNTTVAGLLMLWNRLLESLTFSLVVLASGSEWIVIHRAPRQNTSRMQWKDNIRGFVLLPYHLPEETCYYATVNRGPAHHRWHYCGTTQEIGSSPTLPRIQNCNWNKTNSQNHKQHCLWHSILCGGR